MRGVVHAVVLCVVMVQCFVVLCCVSELVGEKRPEHKSNNMSMGVRVSVSNGMSVNNDINMMHNV